MAAMKLEPLGDSAVVATLGEGIGPETIAAVRRLAAAISSTGRAGITDVVPAYATVTTFYDPAHFDEPPDMDPYGAVCRLIGACAARAGGGPASEPSRQVEIPVCYGGDLGPDIALVAEHCRMTPSQVAALHADADYLVYAIGFTPGFPYLGGLPEALRTPRRDTPRAAVPAGSVAIGGGQTGVYPFSSPGGWQIIGRSPVALFRPALEPASLLRPGDRVRFRAITASEFAAWK
jgi:inhibitor of KinA